MAKKLTLLMPGLEDPEKLKKFQDLVLERNKADYDCYMLLEDLLRKIGGVALKKAFIKSTGFNDAEGDRFVKNINDTIGKREDLNDKALRVLAGRD